MTVRAALETKLKSVSASIETEWENLDFTPVAKKPYQQAFLLLAKPVNSEMGAYFQESGIFQINLRYPFNNGAGDAYTRARLLRSTFYRGLSLSANGVIVTIDQTAEIGPGYRDGDRYVLPVKIGFYSNNPA